MLAAMVEKLVCNNKFARTLPQSQQNLDHPGDLTDGCLKNDVSPLEMGGREGESKGFMAILSDDPTSNLQDV